MRKNLAICYYTTNINDLTLHQISFCDRATTQRTCDQLNALNNGKHYIIEEVDSFY